jgi:hypothetical protein
MIFIDLWGFSIDPPYLGYNSVWQKTLFLAFFNSPGATGLGKGQGQRAWLGNFKTNKMR